MHDIHELLEAGKGTAPPAPYGVDDLVTAGRRRRRRRLTQRIGGAGVVAVALAVTGLLATNTALLSANRPRHGLPEVAAASPTASSVVMPRFTFMFDSYSAGAYRVLPPQEVTATYQSASIVNDYRDSAGNKTIAYVGTLTVYQPGVRPPIIFTTGTKVTVHGLPGVAAARPQDTDSVVNGSGVFANPRGIDANTLAWQYAANSWAVIDSVIDLQDNIGRRLGAADEMALANGFRLGTPSPARVPFQVGHLPAGWQLVSVTGRSFTTEDLAMVTIIFAPSSAAGADRIRHFADTSDGPAVVFAIIHQQIPPPPDAPKTKQTCGHLESDTDMYCSWDIPNSRYAVVVHDPTTTLPTAELIAIGESLTFDNLDEPATWQPVS
jgi:hypothetical protein